MRDTIENVIKECKLERSRIHEVSHLKYASIIDKIDSTFIKNGGYLHWSNITLRFKSCYPLKHYSVSDNPLWFQELDRIIPNELCYVLFEDINRCRTKYWLYEMFPQELITVLSEVPYDDFYIVSKKFKWLISECHEEVVYFVGEEFHLEKSKCFT